MKTLERNGIEFLSLLDKLRENLIIVEGKKDRRALKTLGLYNVIEISGKPLITVVNHILKECEKEHTDVVILTDFDSKGKKIAARLNVLLQSYKIHPNAKLRKSIMEFGKNKIEDFKIEPWIAENISDSPLDKRGDVYGEISANVDKVHHQRKNQSEGSHRKA